MSKYIEEIQCTCDAPTGSENRCCSFCRNIVTLPKKKKRTKRKK